MTAQRFPARLYRYGTEPDARFTLANERTFLAWIRTALALIACGVALETFGPDVQPVLRLAASITLIAGGIAAPIQAWCGWYVTERQLRLGRPLPPARTSFPVTMAVVAAGTLLLLALLVR
ncbi:YidH family protein [Mycobacterium sp. NPDC003449]